MSEPKMSGSALRVFRVLLDREERCSGYEITKYSGITSGTMYPLLRRFENAGWISGEWEESGELGRPRRRTYRLTPNGRAKAGAALDALAPQPTSASRSAAWA